MRRISMLGLSLAAVLPSCGSDAPANVQIAPDAAIDTPSSGEAGGREAASDGGGPARCTFDLDAPSPMTYFIAKNAPGASNDACDGLAPTNEGNGHCPFEDFSSPKTRSLLTNVKGVRVSLRAGTYLISGWDGLLVRGLGTSEAERTVLSSYQHEEVILDVPSPDGALCTDGAAPSKPECVRQVVRLSGSYVTVQGITVQNGLAYALEVNGGSNQVVRCNTLRETVPFDLRSDMLKIDGDATDILVTQNDFSRFRSQAIDMTLVRRVVVEDNDFHHPFDEDAGATGNKFGSHDVTIRNNRIHDLGSDTRTHAFSLGGSGTPLADEFTAYDIKVVKNRIWNVRGIVAQFASCKDCVVSENDVADLFAGVLVVDNFTGDPQCTASPSGCKPSEGVRIEKNRLRGLDGGGDTSKSDMFVGTAPSAGAGLIAGDNVYCAKAVDSARFAWKGTILNFADWKATSGTDATSTVIAASDARCAGW